MIERRLNHWVIRSIRQLANCITHRTTASGQRTSCLQSTILLAGAAIWCAAIVAAPIFHLTFVYDFFSVICHQDPARSWRVAGAPFAVCIRCSSIYFGFLAGLAAGLRPNARILRIAVAVTAAEIIFALLVVDSAALRALSGLALGAAAAPFVRIGMGQILPGAAHDSM